MSCHADPTVPEGHSRLLPSLSAVPTLLRMPGEKPEQTTTSNPASGGALAEVPAVSAAHTGTLSGANIEEKLTGAWLLLQHLGGYVGRARHLSPRASRLRWEAGGQGNRTSLPTVQHPKLFRGCAEDKPPRAGSVGREPWTGQVGEEPYIMRRLLSFRRNANLFGHTQMLTHRNFCPSERVGSACLLLHFNY